MHAVIGENVKPEIYEISEPEGDYAYGPAKIEEMLFPRREASIASVYARAFEEARVNPLFREHFRAVLEENLSRGGRRFDEGGAGESDVKCPEYRIHTSDHDRFAYYVDVRLPEVVSSREIEVYINRNRLVVACLARSYFLDIALPIAVRRARVSTYFNKMTKTLTSKLPIQNRRMRT